MRKATAAAGSPKLSRPSESARSTEDILREFTQTPRVRPPLRPSKIDIYLPFIRQTLESFPTLTASRLYVMAYGRGYRGSPDHLRHLIACHRPRPKAEAYPRLRRLPGEEGQVDWGHFGHLEFGRARCPLMAFVMVLSYSRQPALLP